MSIENCHGDEVLPDPQVFDNTVPCDGCLARITGECPNGYNL